MSNLPEHVGRAQTFEALGQRWTLSRWDRRVWHDFLAWAKGILPDPKKEAAAFLALLPPEDDAARRAVVAEALKQSTDYLSVSSPRVLALLDSLQGMERLLLLLLRPNHPDADEDTAYQLALALGSEKVKELLQACSGIAPKKARSPGGPTEEADEPAVC